MKYLAVGDPAGGDLTGTYPNPSIEANAVAGADVADDSLTGNDVAEASLGQVPNADSLDGFDSSAFARSARASVVLDLPSIPANACINRLMTIPQLLNSDGVVVNPPGNFPLGLVLTPTWDVNTDTLQELRVCNLTGTALDPPNGGYLFTLFRRWPRKLVGTRRASKRPASPSAGSRSTRARAPVRPDPRAARPIDAGRAAGHPSGCCRGRFWVAP